MKFSEKFTIFLGIILVGIFLFGLAWSISTGLAGFWKGLPFWAWSISTGLAGFWKGLPFWIIVIFCLSLLIYDSLKFIKK